MGGQPPGLQQGQGGVLAPKQQQKPVVIPALGQQQNQVGKLAPDHQQGTVERYSPEQQQGKVGVLDPVLQAGGVEGDVSKEIQLEDTNKEEIFLADES